LDGYFPNDITIYENLAGLPNVPLVNVLVGSATGRAGGNNCGGGVGHSDGHFMAPGLEKVIVYEGTIPTSL